MADDDDADDGSLDGGRRESYALESRRRSSDPDGRRRSSVLDSRRRSSALDSTRRSSRRSSLLGLLSLGGNDRSIRNVFGMVGCDNAEEPMGLSQGVLSLEESNQSLTFRGGRSKGDLMGKTARRLSTMVVLLVTDIFKEKAVSFSLAANETKLIEKAEELEEEVRVAMWWTGQEVDDIKTENEQLASAMDAGHTDVDGRGLEEKTEEGNWNAYKARRDATNVVLDEQDRQHRQRFLKLDDEGFRKVYLEVSETSIEQAVKRGKEDEEAVQDYLQDLRKLVKP
jgi:hypothetical protein